MILFVYRYYDGARIEENSLIHTFHLQMNLYNVLEMLEWGSDELISRDLLLDQFVHASNCRPDKSLD